MIGFLSGILREKQPPELMIEVNGVGYELSASMTTFYQLPEVGQPVQLYTHFVVREDAQLLYGFHSLLERRLFRQLIKVSGLGPKLALAILSGIDVDAFVACVRSNDIATLVRIPGIGKKTAERLVIEMQDKLSTFTSSKEPDPLSQMAAAVSDEPSPQQVFDDAHSALVALGYKPAEATKSIRAVIKDGDNREDLIRRALQQMVTKTL